MKTKIDWNNPEEVKAYLNTYQKERYHKNKDKIKIERDKPENKLKHKASMDKWLEENKEHMKIYREENKEREKLRQQTPEYKAKAKERRDKPENKLKLKLYIEEHKEDILKKTKIWKDKPKNKEKVKKHSRRTHLKKLYNLTIEDYNKILEQQDNKCAICRNVENGKRLAIDHCHNTEQVRGLLCKNCNTTLGNLKEDISLFYKCIKYLKKHKE